MSCRWGHQTDSDDKMAPGIRMRNCQGPGVVTPPRERLRGGFLPSQLNIYTD